MSIVGGPRIIQSGLVLYYNVRSNVSFTGSGTWNDLSLSPKVNSSLSTASPNSGFGIYYASGQRIAISSTSSKLSGVMQTGNSWTFETWFASNGEPWSQFEGYIFGRQGFHCGFYQVKNQGGLQMGRYIHWYDDNTIAALTPTSVQTIATGEWYHYVGSVDYSQNFLKTYINGQLWASGTLLRPPRFYGTAQYFLGAGSPGAYSANGRTAVARLYSRPLNGSEILQNYDAEAPFYRG
jgi:hypothetical protein